jgi:uncharacterized OsmC-like protein
MEVNVKLLGDVKFEIEARNHIVVSDQPAENGGNDEGMTPPEFLLASLGSCAAFYASAYLRKKGLPREGVTVHVTAGKAGPPARLDNFKIEVQVPLALSEAEHAGVNDAVHRCLIHNTMLHPPTMQIEVTCNVPA